MCDRCELDMPFMSIRRLERCSGIVAALSFAMLVAGIVYTRWFDPSFGGVLVGIGVQLAFFTLAWISVKALRDLWY